MHSNVSGFTESSNEGPAPQSATYAPFAPGFGVSPFQPQLSVSKAELLEDSTVDLPYETRRKGSSGSSSGNGSVGDPKSPIVGNGNGIYGHSSLANGNGRLAKW
jgi:hypothetical protein